MNPAWGERLLYEEGHLRPIWRIALFFFFLALFVLLALYAISVLPQYLVGWGGVIAVVVAGLLAGWLVLSRFDRRPFGALGFGLYPAALREVLFGTMIGGALIGAAILLLLATGSAAFAPDTGSASAYIRFLASTLLFFTIAAAAEEVIFRGYPFQVLVEWIGPWPATLVASGIFAYLHAENPSVTFLALGNIFLAGILLSLAYLKTRSLWFATALHVGWNWTMASVFDFPVSGLEYDTPLYSGMPIGDPRWTGGAFGPEAGLVGTIVLLAGTVWIARTGRIGVAEPMQALRPIVDRRIGHGAWP